MRIRKRYLLAGLAGVAIAAVGASGVLGARQGPQTLNVAVFPKKLPKKKHAPVRLKIAETTRVNDDSPPNPRLVRAVAKFDRGALVKARGLPRCNRRKLLFTRPKQARNRCRGAIIGLGFANAKVNFPDQDPFFAPAPVTVFNAAPKGGNPAILIHAYALVPAPTTFIVPGVLRRAGGKFRYQMSLRVPRIAGGNGTLTVFRITLNRRYRFRGKKVSYANARCPRGRLLVQVTFHYADNTKRTLTDRARC